MSQAEPAFSIRVECGAGYGDEEAPRRFFLKSREIGVVEIIDRWLGPDHRYFKIRDDDGAIYIIRHDVVAGQWELALFDRNR